MFVYNYMHTPFLKYYYFLIHGNWLDFSGTRQFIDSREVLKLMTNRASIGFDEIYFKQRKFISKPFFFFFLLIKFFGGK